MKKILIYCGVLLLLSMNSCLVSKKIVYLKDLNPAESYSVAPIPPLRIQNNDRLSIQVSAKHTELTAPFNNKEGVYAITEQGNTFPTIIDRGYLVDQQGNIEFPGLGTLNVEGMSLDGLKDFLKNKLQENKLLSSPVVKVELLNLKVLMMGEGGNQLITSSDGRMTLLEAITRAGGLSNNATTDKIAVIREENGVRKIYYNDIESKEIFNSPTYYLQQNDIIYVEPKSSQTRGDEERTWRILGMVMSVITLATTVWAISTR
ncbi:polysaccharide biosynthesis/export family protein [Sphingobacterium bovistauri]|uniref:Polysaccharide biosynthesis/export family protein n=1 Tax=Sphingobacterium bovistauri TaxID=2781959 RepID=A0ABS7Z1T2_9SPHI|nr:polysaccharide biosynthesis/export family protein [Sphingobacterium bovistauri]MCA5004132.1 polysaccharide biosynthesis/export family protein [Sphingobacterium bovistauri]